MDDIESRVPLRDFDAGEIFAVRRGGVEFSVYNGSPADFSRNDPELAVSVRILKDGKMGFAYAYSEDGIAELPAQAADNLFPVEWGWRIERMGDGASSPDIFDGRYFSIRDEEIFDILKTAEASAVKKDSRIKKAIVSSFAASFSEVFVANSFGDRKKGKKTVFSVGIYLIGEDFGGEVQAGGSYASACRFRDLDVDRVVGEAVEDTVSQFGSSAISPKKMAVLLSPASACSFLSVISGWFCADEFIEGRLPPVWKEGSAVASSLVTIVDDGTIDGLPGSFPFDGEGFPTARHKIVSEGVFTGFLSDVRSARVLARSTTANAKRGVSSLPSVGFFNLFVENGKTPPADLTLGEVLKIDEVIGLHLANPETGLFSFGARGRLYKNGKLKKSVRGITVSGCLTDFFRNVVAVGDDLKFYSSVGSPSLLVKDVQISGK
ncbi:MAG: TldD/PmbA family protein [Elusimicrobia bacterium]|nr:TldD/PmbA family protein [Elusimicrobiota bacterium]